MVRVVVVFLLRVVFFLPYTAPVLLVTAMVEFSSPEPDWDYWRAFNDPVLNLLPWRF